MDFCHASEVFHWAGVWWITHCSADSEDFRYRKSTVSGDCSRATWTGPTVPRRA